MRFIMLSGLIALGLGFGIRAQAQTIGVLQSAETVEPGTFKLLVAPQDNFGRSAAARTGFASPDGQFGVSARAGYGFADRFDGEAKLGFFENDTNLGADLEYWLLRGVGLDGSITGGVHYIFGGSNRPDTWGLEVTPQVSGHVTPALELCGAFSASFENVRNAPPGADDTFTRAFAVPGIEYKLSDEADLDGEFGIGLNDNSNHYLAAGITFYLR